MCNADDSLKLSSRPTPPLMFDRSGGVSGGGAEGPLLVEATSYRRDPSARSPVRSPFCNPNEATSVGMTVMREMISATTSCKVADMMEFVWKKELRWM